MTTLINEATRARLAWLQEQLAALHDNNWVRSEGEHIFSYARQELADINANAVEPVTNPPATVLTVMTPEQVGRVVAGITDDMESGDLAIIDAIAATRADVLAAIPKAAPTEAQS